MAAIDLDRLAKVRALHDGTTNPGEKAAAATRMRVIAEKAGITVEAALSKLDTPNPQTRAEAFASAFNDLMNTPGMRAFRTEQEQRRAERRAAALAEHGSEDALFADTVWERRLRLACEPLIEPRPIIGGFMDTLAGWTAYQRNMPASVRAAVTGAYRLPVSVAEAWAEREAWEELDDDRAAFSREYQHRDWVIARQMVVEELLDTIPAAGADDVMARIAWLRAVTEREWSRDVNEDTALIDRLAADMATMAGVVTALAAIVERVKVAAADSSAPDLRTGPVQSGHPSRTRGERRQAVLGLFGQGLTDREIARRVGISPTTVGNLRREAQAGR